MEVRIPSASDHPRTWHLVAIAAVGLALGLAVASWGMDPAREADERSAEAGRQAPAGHGTSPSPVGERGEPDRSAQEPSDPAGEVDDVAAPADPSSASETASASEPSTPSDPSMASPGGGPGAPAERQPGEGAGAEQPVPSPSAQDGARSAPAGRPSTVHPGRVAYLRCDGLGRSGPSCPRDETLERAVWAALQQLPGCAQPPAAAGRADIRLDYVADQPPEVRWRDTFADDVVRLDREAVLGCLREPLGATRQTIGAQRLILSFRFRAQ